MTGAILDHLWQSSLVALLIGLLTLLFRNNSAGVRHRMWLAASIKFLFPFSLLVWAGHRLFTHAVAGSSIRMLARVETVTVPFAAAAPPLAQPHALPWSMMAMMAVAVWALGFAAIVAFWLVQWARLAAIARSAKLAPLDAPVPVRITSALLEPGLFGIIRPVILLPGAMAQRLASREIDAIIAHELCHLRRRDNLLASIHMLVEAVFWFHPLVWFIGARLIEESERACDDGVLDGGKKPLDYAQTILKVCRLTFPSPLPCASGMSGSDLDRRITAIMVRRGIDEVDPNKILLLTGLALFAILTPMVSGGLVPAANVHALQNFVRMLPVAQQARQQARQPAMEAVSKVGTARHHPVHHAALWSPPPAAVVAAPAIRADMPVIILAVPQLAADSTPSNADAADAIVCRPPQQLPDSRLFGPRTCLSQQTWDRYRAQGLVLMPDGRTVLASYNQARTRMQCMSMVATASHPEDLIPACR